MVGMAAVRADVGTDIVASQGNGLSCVLIPAQGEMLLLPNVCVGEIVSWRRIRADRSTPHWCLGYLDWRGQTVPVIQYTALNNPDAEKIQQARCLVVMNRSHIASAPAFYAFAADSLPRMLQLLDDDLHSGKPDIGEADMVKVMVGTEDATIPNLAFIEECLRDLL